MVSVFERSAELIGRIAKSGLLQQDEDQRDTDAAKIELRRAWASELASLPTRRRRELPALALAAEKARVAELEAWHAANQAREAYQAAMLRSMMAQSALDGREAQLSWLLEGHTHPTVPDQDPDKDMPVILAYLHNVDDQVALMLETLRHACRATHERSERDGWGRERFVDIYNSDEIATTRNKLEAIRDALRLSMHRADLDPPKQRQEADDLLRRAEQIAIPIFQGSPAEGIFRRERERLFGVKKVA
ncbi:hypothetical protein C0Z18_15145 [Trinickia dabaoshanensis]|uniref:Uncharacterized protein n=1 Tax=Trinickia dabaoshanensis TaxID=564714 RepID=A0A2N7VPR6_9BURK|nr:hypothetical protein [Trinickia dabaoshanensis]PMS19143.1 hypothetical protein C0Z18_15145 [Trinickia dabaoshanensis]